MGMIKPANKVIFANFELEKAFNSLAENIISVIEKIYEKFKF